MCGQIHGYSLYDAVCAEGDGGHDDQGRGGAGGVDQGALSQPHVGPRHGGDERASAA